MNVAQRFAYDEGDTDDTRSEKVAIFLVAVSCRIAGIVWGATYYAVLGWGLSAALPLGFSVGVGAALLVAHYSKAHRIARRAPSRAPDRRNLPTDQGRVRLRAP